MTDYYVHHDGSSTSPYETKVKAAASVEGLIVALAAAGTPIAATDRIFILQGHAFVRTDSTNITWNLPLLLDPGLQIIAVTDVVPAEALATARVTVTQDNHNRDLRFLGSAYISGIHFTGDDSGSSGNTIHFQGWNDPCVQTFDDCKFELRGGHNDAKFRLGIGGAQAPDATRYRFKDCVFETITTTAFFYNMVLGRAEFRGCSLVGPAGAVTSLCDFMNESTGTLLFENCDLTGATLTNLVNVGAAASNSVLFKNCLIGASTAATTGTMEGHGGIDVEIHNTDDASGTNYRYEKHVYAGTIMADDANYVAGGASNGTDTISHDFTTSAFAELIAPLEGPEISQWVDGDGTGLTCTVDFCHDANLTGGDLDNGDIWLELIYLASASNPKGSTVTNRVEIPFGTVADHSTAQSGEWTVASMTTKNTQQMSVNFTPAQPGYVQARVKMALASKTIYVDPRLVITTT